MTTDNLRRNIKALRKKYGLTQGAIAAALGITRSAYGNYEQGSRDIPPMVIKDIATYYGVSAADLASVDYSSAPMVIMSAGMLDLERQELEAMSHAQLVEHCLSLAVSCRQLKAAYKGYKKIVEQIQNNVNSIPPNLDDL
jgi:transcriptional regulator with XRE-family HTH domain